MDARRLFERLRGHDREVPDELLPSGLVVLLVTGFDLDASDPSADSPGSARLKERVVLNVNMGIGATSEATRILAEAATQAPNSLNEWMIPMMVYGIAAVREAVAELFETDRDVLSVNTLSTMGNLVSEKLRQRVLRHVLTINAWNMTAAARDLGFADASALRREIRRLGLQAEWRAAHARGDIVPGAHRSK
ncbi:MAG TPA: hypothetical protein VHH11_13830 [Gammaproteobacteria bacterium]|nr:hypothetical protein [Gammaproteobacteria bacterium]